MNKKNANLNSDLVLFACNNRISQIKNHPLPASLDAAYIKQLNGYIFQDVAEFNVSYPAGSFREASSEGEFTVSSRTLSDDTSIYCMRSLMDKKAFDRFNEKLKSIDVDKLKLLTTEDICQELASLYEILDYTHPFIDGNSRTFRTFIAQVGNAAGFKVEWGKLGNSNETRDALYCARAIGCANLALKDPDQALFKEYIENIFSSLKDNRYNLSLADLFIKYNVISRRKEQTLRNSNMTEKRSFYELNTLAKGRALNDFDYFSLENQAIVPEASSFIWSKNKERYSEPFTEIAKKCFFQQTNTDSLNLLVDDLKKHYLKNYVMNMTQLSSGHIYVSSEEPIKESLEFLDTPQEINEYLEEHSDLFISKKELTNPDLKEYLFNLGISTDLTYSFSLSEFTKDLGCEPEELSNSILREVIIEKLEKESAGIFIYNPDSFEIDEIWRSDDNSDEVNIGISNIHGDKAYKFYATSEEDARQKLSQKINSFSTKAFFGSLFENCENSFSIDLIHANQLSVSIKDTEVQRNYRLSFNLDERMEEKFKNLCLQAEDALNEKSFEDFLYGQCEDELDFSFEELASAKNIETIDKKLNLLRDNGDIEIQEPFDLKEVLTDSCKALFKLGLEKNFAEILENSLLNNITNGTLKDISANEKQLIELSKRFMNDYDEQTLQGADILDLFKHYVVQENEKKVQINENQLEDSLSR